VAVCESYAFVEKDIRKVIEKGLSYIPSDCEYSRAVRDIMAFYDRCPQDWRECFD
ncbi:MAG TPA: ADP-ribosylglycohydrolase family protein, partial [Lachnospiraceae bacterium]|nr:ADP-ribosylglycohydrolase family protein [Lachnospiraceae bacterium]